MNLTERIDAIYEARKLIARVYHAEMADDNEPFAKDVHHIVSQLCYPQHKYQRRAEKQKECPSCSEDLGNALAMIVQEKEQE